MVNSNSTSNPESNVNLQNPSLEHKRCGIINEFLWTCAGVNKQVLRQCPSDYAKYAGIGGTILFTAMMAAMSGGYALNFVFDSKVIAIMFGIFWGLLIFNLDRFIVNTMYSDGKHTISCGELKSGLPRIIMAIFLGIVISTPLELKIFSKEIDAKMQENMKKQTEAYVREDIAKLDSLRIQRERLRESPLDVQYAGEMGATDVLVRQKLQQLSALRNSESELVSRIGSLLDQIRILDSSHNYSDSVKAVRLTAQRAKLNGELSNVRGKKNELDISMRSLSADYRKLMTAATAQRKADLDALDARIKSLDEKINNSETAYIEILRRNFGGLQAQMKAFSNLREENFSTNIAAWFIMLLFVIIETAPTFFKMMMASGPYDDLLRAEMHRVHVLSEKRISDLNDEVNTSVRISTMRNRERLEAEAIANEDILKRIAKVQAELLQKSIDAWREEELRKIAENPTAYIKVGLETETAPK